MSKCLTVAWLYVPWLTVQVIMCRWLTVAWLTVGWLNVRTPKCSLPQNVHFGGSVCTSRTFLIVDQSSPNFFRPTWKGLWLTKFFFRCSICRSVPETFAIKVESCQISRRNLDVFGPPKFQGAGLLKNVRRLSPLPRGTSSGKVSWRYSHQPRSYWCAYAEF